MYKKCADIALIKWLIIADTKFEIGLLDGQIILIDEILTPDSSRFWSLEEYKPGRSQKSFDKQHVRDWLSNSGWDKTPPGPKLPDDIIKKFITFLSVKPSELKILDLLFIRGIYAFK
ncbi:MAG: hypothetical protein GY729_08735 [Desulfobacteraceae bacterium]|nr:hypothetical protein [Desulfobacteraceae bacterium]